MMHAAWNKRGESYHPLSKAPRYRVHGGAASIFGLLVFLYLYINMFILCFLNY